MFDKKKTNLFEQKPVANKKKNAFVKEAEKNSHEIFSGNGALKYSTSGNEFVDDFVGLAGYLKPRTYTEVSSDMKKLWSIDPKNTIKMILYSRLITRDTKLSNGKSIGVNRGQALKAEAIWREVWLLRTHPAQFKLNVNLFIAAGSWNDIIEMMSLDLQYNGWSKRMLDWDFLINCIYAGLTNPHEENLVKKYLPTIRSKSACKTLESQARRIVAVTIAKTLFSKNKKPLQDYRKLKASGKAHVWQQLITKHKMDEIDFNSIPGRALQKLVKSKALSNWNLTEKYSEWIKSKSTVKFTGYVHELFRGFDSCKSRSEDRITSIERDTINAQFNKLIEVAKTDMNLDSAYLVAIDISGSMHSEASGTHTTSLNVAKSIALYFSELLHGEFADSYVVFDDDCKLKHWIGDTPCDKFMNEESEAYGSTNFLSVISLIIEVRKKHPEIPESEFPKGVLCISDGEFNRVCRNRPDIFTYEKDLAVTNFSAAREMLKSFFSKQFVDDFKIVLWDVPNSYYSNNPKTKFEDFADCPNLFHISGYDPSVVSFLTGKSEFKASPTTSEELFKEAMDQTLLNKVELGFMKSK